MLIKIKQRPGLNQNIPFPCLGLELFDVTNQAAVILKKLQPGAQLTLYQCFFDKELASIAQID